MRAVLPVSMHGVLYSAVAYRVAAANTKWSRDCLLSIQFQTPSFAAQIVEGMGRPTCLPLLAEPIESRSVDADEQAQ
jgi:hypothetical protein